MLLKRILSPLLLLIFLDSFGYFLVIPVLIRLIYDTQFSILPLATTLAQRNIIMGVAIAVGFLAMIIAAPYIGSCSDKYGRKKTFLLCLIISLCGFIIPIIAIVKQSIWGVIIGRFIAGVGSASQPVAQATVADIAQGKQKAFYLSLIAFAMTFALLIAPLIGGYLSDPRIFIGLNTTTPYYIGSALVILNIILLWYCFNETASKHNMPPQLSMVKIITALPDNIKRYHIGKLLVAMFLLEFGWSQYYNSIMQYLTIEYVYTATEVSVFAAYVGGLMCMGLLFLYPWLLKYFAVEKILMISVILVATGGMGCAFIPGITAQWLLVILISVFTGISYVSLLALLSNRVAPSHQGWLMGYAMTALALAWFITGMFSGQLLNNSINLPLKIAALALLVTCFFVKGNSDRLPKEHL